MMNTQKQQNPWKRMKEPLLRLWWFGSGLATGLVVLQVALGAPVSHSVTDDTALYRDLREIEVQKKKDLNFDSDVNRLARLEETFAEDLPPVDSRGRLMNPTRRVLRKTKHSYQARKR